MGATPPLGPGAASTLHESLVTASPRPSGKEPAAFRYGWGSAPERPRRDKSGRAIIRPTLRFATVNLMTAQVQGERVGYRLRGWHPAFATLRPGAILKASLGALTALTSERKVIRLGGWKVDPRKKSTRFSVELMGWLMVLTIAVALVKWVLGL